MSKMLLAIDLPDDSKCFKCPQWIGYGADGCELVKQTDNGNRPTRPSDCPLIPVDRVIGRIRSMQGERKASGLDHWNDALDDALEILRIELGVTEL